MDETAIWSKISGGPTIVLVNGSFDSVSVKLGREKKFYNVSLNFASGGSIIWGWGYHNGGFSCWFGENGVMGGRVGINYDQEEALASLSLRDGKISLQINGVATISDQKLTYVSDFTSAKTLVFENFDAKGKPTTWFL